MRQVAFSWNISVLVKKNRFIDSISFDSVFFAIRIYTCYKFMVQLLSGGLGPGRLAGNEAVQMTCGMIDF